MCPEDAGGFNNSRTEENADWFFLFPVISFIPFTDEIGFAEIAVAADQIDCVDCLQTVFPGGILDFPPDAEMIEGDMPGAFHIDRAVGTRKWPGAPERTFARSGLTSVDPLELHIGKVDVADFAPFRTNDPNAGFSVSQFGKRKAVEGTASFEIPPSGSGEGEIADRGGRREGSAHGGRGRTDGAGDAGAGESRGRD